MNERQIELQKPNKQRQPNLRKCNVVSRFFSPYKPFKIKKYNWWFNAYQGNVNIKNVFSIRWQWICDSLFPQTEFGVNILRFVFPFLYRSRALFSFHLHKWDKQPAIYLTIELLFFPSLDFRIGDGKTWRWIRNENWYGYKIHKQNKKNNLLI